VARPKAFDDATAVTAARDVFWEHGYASTSLAQLQAATGLSKSSLYETYGSKRGLFDRAVQNYLDVVITPRLGPLEAAGADRAALIAYFTGLAEFFTRAPDRMARRGCLLLNTAMELTELDPAAADLVRKYRLRVRTAFAGAVHAILAEPGGDPEHGVDPERRADLLTAGQIGLMLTSRLDPAVAAGLAESLAADVRSW
jgi:TetR/AcrR family transcriptional repressor of nem operon